MSFVQLAIWERELSPSFLRILATWLPAVRSETESSLAIWRLVSPGLQGCLPLAHGGLGQRATGCPELLIRPCPLLGTHPFRRRHTRLPPRTSWPAFGEGRFPRRLVQPGACGEVQGCQGARGHGSHADPISGSRSVEAERCTSQVRSQNRRIRILRDVAEHARAMYDRAINPFG